VRRHVVNVHGHDAPGVFADNGSAMAVPFGRVVGHGYDPQTGEPRVRVDLTETVAAAMRYLGLDRREPEPRCRPLGHGIDRVLSLLREVPGVWYSESELAVVHGLHKDAVSDALRIIQERGIRLEHERACAVEASALAGQEYEPATMLWRLP
jgi:hypothetical protein